MGALIHNYEFPLFDGKPNNNMMLSKNRMFPPLLYKLV